MIPYFGERFAVGSDMKLGWVVGLVALGMVGGCRSSTEPQAALATCHLIGAVILNYVDANGTVFRVDTIGAAYQKTMFCVLPPGVDSLLNQRH